MSTDVSNPPNDARLRRQATAQGLQLQKSRVRSTTCDDQGGYRIIDPNRNTIEVGERFDLNSR